ncbi:hypothetical protein ABES38_08140 [Bacillus gobiensis]|uniref:hypothetical protein n=1 Tax=Bacillus gobiensis TaxID=1441095 RepID=UPI003D1C10B2
MDGANKIANDSSTLYIDGNGGVALTNKSSGGANMLMMLQFTQQTHLDQLSTPLVQILQLTV